MNFLHFSIFRIVPCNILEHILQGPWKESLIWIQKKTKQNKIESESEGVLLLFIRHIYFTYFTYNLLVLFWIYFGIEMRNVGQILVRCALGGSLVSKIFLMKWVVCNCRIWVELKTMTTLGLERTKTDSLSS